MEVIAGETISEVSPNPQQRGPQVDLKVVGVSGN